MGQYSNLISFGALSMHFITQGIISFHDLPVNKFLSYYSSDINKHFRCTLLSLATAKFFQVKPLEYCHQLLSEIVDNKPNSLV